MSNSEENRIEEGLRMLRELQLYYEPIITEENLPYVAAASIVSGGPFFKMEQELDELIASIEEAKKVVTVLRGYVKKWNEISLQQEVSEKA